ncbi:10112_t:CDS:2, partial [Ambispora leptoticha]
MWSIAIGQRPVRAHDYTLVIDISIGHSFELNETFSEWITDIYDNPAPTEISEEFNVTEERRREAAQTQKNKKFTKMRFTQIDFLNFNNSKKNMVSIQ